MSLNGHLHIKTRKILVFWIDPWNQTILFENFQTQFFLWSIIRQIAWGFQSRWNNWIMTWIWRNQQIAEFFSNFWYSIIFQLHWKNICLVVVKLYLDFFLALNASFNSTSQSRSSKSLPADILTKFLQIILIILNLLKNYWEAWQFPGNFPFCFHNFHQRLLRSCFVIR